MYLEPFNYIFRALLKAINCAKPALADCRDKKILSSEQLTQFEQGMAMMRQQIETQCPKIQNNGMYCIPHLL